ncbi:hypothetical protein TUM12370_23710 [Salmonella enterica subsp. enterica serovar Choleraesuis]|nr:hypothetical protein TUM12370_23710 [Salmonella enterica subsp. enterica serovar Choleraesuis]
MSNREVFLTNIARQLGREMQTVPAPCPEPLNHYATTRLTELSEEQRYQAFVDFARQTMQVECQLVAPDRLAQTAVTLCERAGGPVVISGDRRLEEAGISAALIQQAAAQPWEAGLGAANITRAAAAHTGVVWADYGLVESGGVVLFSTPEQGRSLSLLPETTIFVLRRSTLLPRVAQLAALLAQRARLGERMPSCINLIAGPSSTADIELIKVVGVHGPVNAIYLIADC